jgi:hypothetical protein
MSPLFARLAIMGVSVLVSTVIPFFIQTRPLATLLFDRLGPRIVDRATDVIIDKVGPPIPEVRPDCPPCPPTQPAPPAPKPDVDVVVPTPAPPAPLPVRIVDETATVVDNTVDAATDVVKQSVTWVDQLARRIIKFVLD